MIYSRSAEYAIRALVVLGSLPSGESARVKNVAAEAGIPEHFLAKILQDLARNGFLKSNKGPRGGFRLALPAAEIPLLKVVESVDGVGRCERCIAGNEACDDRVLCGLHDAWMPVRAHIIEWLTGTSIADAAKCLREKRRLLVRSRPATGGGNRTMIRQGEEK